MAARCLTTISEQWIRERLKLKHPCLGDVRSLNLPGTYEEKIRNLGNALINFIRLKSLDLSCNALVSVEGLQHLKKLETLILYYNCIPSLEEVKLLHELTSLKELDLRLNPLTKSNPNYRPYLVHAMPSLRKLDSCSVRDIERKAAIMQFSSDPFPNQKDSCLQLDEFQRSSDERLASVDHLTKRLSLLTDTSDIVLNSVEHRESESKDFKKLSSATNQEMAKSMLRCPPTKYDNAKSKLSYMKAPSHKKASSPIKAAERPKVSFGRYEEQCNPLPEEQKDFPKQTRHMARGHFTPNPDPSCSQCSAFRNIRPPSPYRPGLSDPSNPVLHPPRLTYSSFNKTEESSLMQQTEKKNKGGYRKPLEMLLNLVDKHWRGEGSLHHNNNFLSQAVQILSMMEKDISSREAEVRALRREADALSFQVAAREEEYKTEVCNLSAKLEQTHSEVDKLSEQLRTVLEENVTLQKQLIKFERQNLRSLMKSSPISQIKEAQAEVEELRKEIKELRWKVHQAEKVKEVSDLLQESQVPGGHQ